MGHGTTVPDEYDIDLVIYSRGKFNSYNSTRQLVLGSIVHLLT